LSGLRPAGLSCQARLNYPNSPRSRQPRFPVSPPPVRSYSPTVHVPSPGLSFTAVRGWLDPAHYLWL